MSVIAEEDTVTGFLLGGIGELDKERQSNFLVRPIIISTKTYMNIPNLFYFIPCCRMAVPALGRHHLVSKSRALVLKLRLWWILQGNINCGPSTQLNYVSFGSTSHVQIMKWPRLMTPIWLWMNSTLDLWFKNGVTWCGRSFETISWSIRHWNSFDHTRLCWYGSACYRITHCANSNYSRNPIKGITIWSIKRFTSKASQVSIGLFQKWGAYSEWSFHSNDA